MRGRDKTGGKAVTTPGRKPRRHNAPEAEHQRRSVHASKEINVEELIRARNEAVEQQRATTEILRIGTTRPTPTRPSC